jgi:glyoxylase-like metal-dependent hydrolase (beta-lactamase superfamily II)
MADLVCPRRDRRRLPTVALGCALSLVALPAPAKEPFAVDLLGDGVHLFRPPVDATDRTNSLVVERGDGLLVVGAQPSPAAARRLLAAIGARFEAPVRYLVLPHSHADAAGGASAFPDSVLVIGGSGCRSAMVDADYDFGAEARVRAGGDGWTEPPRRPPALVLEARATLADERNEVELLPFGGGHSPGDMLVRVPGHGVFFAGALIFPDRKPYAGDSSIGKWMSALNHFVRQSPRVLVPLRGAIVGNEELRRQRDALAWLRGQVENGLTERWPHEEILRRILEMPEAAERFAVESPFFEPLVRRTIRQAVETRVKLFGG